MISVDAKIEQLKTLAEDDSEWLCVKLEESLRSVGAERDTLVADAIEADGADEARSEHTKFKALCQNERNALKAERDQEKEDAPKPACGVDLDFPIIEINRVIPKPIHMPLPLISGDKDCPEDRK